MIYLFVYYLDDLAVCTLNALCWEMIKFSCKNTHEYRYMNQVYDLMLNDGISNEVCTQ